MKKSFLLIILFAIISCTNYTNIKDISKEYTIEKIDSLNSYYLIYAKKNNSLFKIVSKKDYIRGHRKIKIGSNYKLYLQSRKSQAPVINGVKISPINIIDIMCYNYDNNTEICTDEKNGISDLYSTKNLKGLYYIK